MGLKTKLEHMLMVHLPQNKKIKFKEKKSFPNIYL